MSTHLHRTKDFDQHFHSHPNSAGKWAQEDVTKFVNDAAAAAKNKVVSVRSSEKKIIPVGLKFVR